MSIEQAGYLVLSDEQKATFIDLIREYEITRTIFFQVGFARGNTPDFIAARDAWYAADTRLWDAFDKLDPTGDSNDPMVLRFGTILYTPIETPRVVKRIDLTEAISL